MYKSKLGITNKDHDVIPKHYRLPLAQIWDVGVPYTWNNNHATLAFRDGQHQFDKQV